MRLAFVNTFPNLPCTAEKEFIHRLLITAPRINWEIREVITSEDIQQFDPDLVLVPHEFSPKLTRYPTVGLIWSPACFWQEDRAHCRNILSWDGYIPLSDINARALKDLLFAVGKEAPVADFPICPTCYRTEFMPIGLANVGGRASQAALFYAGVHWDGQRHGDLFRQVAERCPMRIFGPREKWTQVGKAYKGEVACDGRTLLASIRKAGVALCIHKQEHRTWDTVSMRLFEAAAAGAVVIADDMPWTRKHFGDTVLYIDMEQPTPRLAAQIEEHMRWVRENPQDALTLAEQSHRVFCEKLCLEKQLEPLPAFARQVRRAGCFDRAEYLAPHAEPPVVEYIMRIGSRPASMVRRSLDALRAQTYPRLGIILVQFDEVAGLGELVDDVQGAFASFKVVHAPKNGLRSTTLWAGMKAVSAPFFGNNDDDDLMHPNHVALLMRKLLKTPDALFGYTGALQVQEERGYYFPQPHFNGPENRTIPENRTLFALDFPDTPRLFRFDNFIASNAWIARRDILDDAILEDPEMCVSEDMYLYLLFALKTRFAFVPTPTIEWNWRSLSKDNSMFKEAAFLEGASRIRGRLSYVAAEVWRAFGAPPVSSPPAQPVSNEAIIVLQNELQRVRADKDRVQDALQKAEARVNELQTSRWRRLGLRLGIAKPTSFEREAAWIPSKRKSSPGEPCMNPLKRLLKAALKKVYFLLVRPLQARLRQELTGELQKRIQDLKDDLGRLHLQHHQARAGAVALSGKLAATPPDPADASRIQLEIWNELERMNRSYLEFHRTLAQQVADAIATINKKMEGLPQHGRARTSVWRSEDASRAA